MEPIHRNTYAFLCRKEKGLTIQSGWRTGTWGRLSLKYSGSWLPWPCIEAEGWKLGACCPCVDSLCHLESHVMRILSHTRGMSACGPNVKLEGMALSTQSVRYSWGCACGADGTDIKPTQPWLALSKREMEKGEIVRMMGRNYFTAYSQSLHHWLEAEILNDVTRSITWHWLSF